jgi:hypothetical protein
VNIKKTSQDVSDVIVISVVSGKGSKVTVVLSFLILM